MSWRIVVAQAARPVVSALLGALATAGLLSAEAAHLFGAVVDSLLKLSGLS